MIYILEGTDGTGKSTLSKDLCKKHNADYFHCTYYEDEEERNNQFAKVFEMMKNYIRLDKNLVIDRFILSNVVYGCVYNNESGWNIVKNLINFLGFYKKNCGLIKMLFCLPENKEKYLKHYKKLTKNRNELYPDIQKMGLLHDKFKFLFEKLDDGTFEIFDLIKKLEEK